LLKWRNALLAMQGRQLANLGYATGLFCNTHSLARPMACIGKSDMAMNIQILNQ